MAGFGGDRVRRPSRAAKSSGRVVRPSRAAGSGGRVVRPGMDYIMHGLVLRK